jgi:flagellar protein FliS
MASLAPQAHMSRKNRTFPPLLIATTGLPVLKTAGVPTDNGDIRFMQKAQTAMFASATLPSNRQQLGAYRQVGVTTGVDGASPHRLVAMLFEGLLDALAQARGALRSGNVEAKCESLSRAVRIIDEGLRAGLNLTEGGRLAADLNDLYAYVTLRLTHANRHNDEAAIEECARLIDPLSKAWNEMASQVDA